LSSIDRKVNDDLKSELVNYSGFSIINIDPTALTEEQLTQLIETTIGQVIEDFSADYTNEHNELVSPEVSKRFYKIDKTRIGLIFNTDSIINREVGYLRKQFFQGVNRQKDWGVGKIISKKFDGINSINTVFILPKSKFY
jgi:hypothetical protein